MNEKEHTDALIKSLPTGTPAAIKQSIKIAQLRLAAALVTGRPTAAIITEIEQRVEQAMMIEKKKQRLANKTRPIVSTPAYADRPVKTEPIPIERPTTVPAQPPDPPAPPEDELAVPAEFTDWTFIPVTTGEQIRIGAPIAFTADDQTFAKIVHDQYLFNADERFDRTPLFIDNRLIDAGDWAALFDALEFIKSFGKEYAPFIANVFLPRFAHLTRFEETTRKNANEFRLIRCATVQRWTTALTLLLQGAERALIGQTELLTCARAHLNRLTLDRLYDVQTGRIKVRAVEHTDEQIAAENKLINLLVEQTRDHPTRTDVAMLCALRRNLKLSAAVIEDMDAILNKLERAVDAPKRATRVEKERMANDLTALLSNDPLLVAARARLRLPDEIAQSPFALFRWLIELTEKTRSSGLDQATNHLMTNGLDLTQARELAAMLALRPNVVEKKLTAASGGKIGAIFLVDANNALARLTRPRLRFALVEFVASTLNHFSDSSRQRHHASDRLKSTAAYFIRADELIERFARAWTPETSDMRRYILENTAQEKIIGKRLAAGFNRFDQLSTLATDIGRCLSALLTEEEKDRTNANAWFCETFQIDNETWDSILAEYDLPGLANADEKARAAFERCRAKTVQANIWSIVSNARGYPFRNIAVTSLRQRAREGKIEILHNMAAAGIDVSPFCAEISAAMATQAREVKGAAELPPAVLNQLVAQITSAIVDRQIVARHWPQWVAKSAALLVRANEMLVQSGQPAKAREKSLRLLIKSKKTHRTRLLEKIS